MSCTRVEVHVPASTANLGAGLDALGLALDLRNKYIISIGSAGPDITITGEGAGHLPLDETHPTYLACMGWLTRFGQRPAGLVVRQHNNVPYSGGLGNSATAVVAGVMAAGLLAGRPLSAEEVLQAATDIEGHPDNVAPAIYGGLVVSASYPDSNKQVVTAHVALPGQIVAVLAIPNFTLSTMRSRQVLPTVVDLRAALYNVSRSSLFVAAVAGNHLELLAAAMDDRLHQPYRAALVPGLAAVCQAARNAGAYGAALSGSGPTVLALCSPDKSDPDQIGQAMATAFAQAGVTARTMVVNTSQEGAVAGCAG